MEHILTMLIFFPAVAAILGFLIDKDSMRQFALYCLQFTLYTKGRNLLVTNNFQWAIIIR